MSLKNFSTLTIAVCLFTWSHGALADSFTIIQDGKEYLCEAKTSPSPGGAAACATQAYNGPFSRDEATQLCSGAVNTAPATCGIKAYNGPFSRSEAVQLCRGARRDENNAADCGVKAYNGPFSRAEAVQLCSSGGDLERAECAITAYNGPYSREEAIRLCRGDARLLLRSLRLMESSSEMRSKIQMMKLRQKQSSQE